MFIGVHDQRDVTAVRSIFLSQMRVGADGFDVVR